VGGFQPGTAPVEDVLAHYLEACEESRQITAAYPLDHVAFSEVYGQPVSHRFVLAHMVGEYARHCGHADSCASRSTASLANSQLAEGRSWPMLA
jgi:hypothetical protein